ncbi:putative quinol monooxygenase [Erwinia sp. V71]|uniref:putative quinol monooxygenase n=1 Tax=Erwinia sp. V71 TaxID=3369424 RepID=UPI003F5EB19F
MIEVIAAFSAKPGKEDALRKATLDVVEPTRAESGCVQFVVHEDLNQPGAFFIRETWKSQEDLDKHFQMPYLQNLVELHKELLAGELKLHQLKVY